MGAAALLMAINQLFSREIELAIALGGNLLLYSFLYLAIWIILPNGNKTLWEMLALLKTFKHK
jgi:uncharacterized membrane protein